MSKTVRMLKGLPASGKTSYAKKLVSTDASYGRINRDDLRKLVFSNKFSNYNEKIIIDIEVATAKSLLSHGRNVVIDDTNLGEKHYRLWEGVANDCGARFEVQEINTSTDECIRRDLERKESVGRNVITKMAAKYGLIAWPDKPIVLVDIDGTLSDGEHRQHFIRGEQKQWKEYFELLEGDLPIVHIFKWVAELSKDHTIVIVSGRNAEHEEETLKWFEKVWAPNPLFPELEVPRFPVFQYFFRNKGDKRPDDIVKEEVLKLLPYKPILVIDDRPVVIRMWRKNNIPVIPVAGECEEF